MPERDISRSRIHPTNGCLPRIPAAVDSSDPALLAREILGLDGRCPWPVVRDIYDSTRGGWNDSDAQFSPLSEELRLSSASSQLIESLQKHGVSIGCYRVPGVEQHLALPVIVPEDPKQTRQCIGNDRHPKVMGCVVDGQAFSRQAMPRLYRDLVYQRAQLLRERVRQGTGFDMSHTSESLELNDHEHAVHVTASLVGVLLQLSPPETNYRVFRKAFGSLEKFGLPDVVFRSIDGRGVEMMVRPPSVYFNTYYPSPQHCWERVEASVNRLRELLVRFDAPDVIVEKDFFQVAHRWEGVRFTALTLSAPRSQAIRAISALRQFLRDETKLFRSRVGSPRQAYLD